MAGDPRDHWAVLLALRALARLRDALISAVLSALVFGCIAIVVVSLMFGMEISEGFAYVGNVIQNMLPPWMVYLGRFLWVAATGFILLGVIIGSIWLLIRWLRRSGRERAAGIVESIIGWTIGGAVAGGLIYSLIYRRDLWVEGGKTIAALIALMVVAQGLWLLGRAVKRKLGFKVRGDEFEPKNIPAKDP